MPQDIPLEGSETLPFTPAALAGIPNPPQFVLRTPTPRDKRWHRRLHLENGIKKHSAEDVRDQILRGLKKFWAPEVYESHVEILKAYWEAEDDWVQQKLMHDKEHAPANPSDGDDAEAPKIEPFPDFSYDPEIVAACEELTGDLADKWPRLGKMLADNADFPELAQAATVAVVVMSWTGLAVERDIDVDRERQYLRLDCAEALRDALEALEYRHNLAPGTAWAQLFIACNRRMFLNEDEAKNSASPSPSGMTLPASNPSEASEQDGPSPASAISAETPAIS